MNMPRGWWLILIGGELAALAGCGKSDIGDLQRFVAETRQRPPKQELDPLPEIKPYQPFYYEAQGLRDPFAPSQFVVDALTRRAPVVDNGLRPDTDRPQEELEKYSLGALELVGTFRDFQTNEMWALIKAPDGIVHRVQIGNFIGENFGEINNITEDRVSIQEIVRDPETGSWQERQNFLSLAQ